MSTLSQDDRANLGKVKTADQARDELEFLQSKLDCCLVIDGESLQVCLELHLLTLLVGLIINTSSVSTCSRTSLLR